MYKWLPPLNYIGYKPTRLLLRYSQPSRWALNQKAGLIYDLVESDGTAFAWNLAVDLSRASAMKNF